MDTGIFVEKNRITAVVKVFTEAFMWKYNIIPDQDGFVSSKILKESAEKYKKVIFTNLIISEPSSKPYYPKIIELEKPNFPKNGVNTLDLAKKYVRYIVEYTLASEPQKLSFQQTFGFEECIPCIMTIDLQRENLPSVKTTFELENNIKTFAFDWNYREKKGLLRKAWLKQNKIIKPNKSIINKLSSIYPYIYISDDNIRIELLTPTYLINKICQLGYPKYALIKSKDINIIKSQIKNWFESKVNLQIDGIPVKPLMKPLTFFAGTSFAKLSKDIPIASSSVGAIFTYATKGRAEEIKINWNLFPLDNKSIRSMIFPYKKSFSNIFTPKKNEFVWQRTNKQKNITKHPTIVKMSKTPIDTTTAIQLSSALLKNIYRAFDYSTESDIYDALSNSVSGKLLAQTYLAIKKSLIMKDQGGGISKVEKVKILNVNILTKQSIANHFEAEIKWTIKGFIEHWGHIHYRLNEYKAQFNLEIKNKHWKITELTIISAKRLQTYYMPRKLAEGTSK